MRELDVKPTSQPDIVLDTFYYFFYFFMFSTFNLCWLVVMVQNLPRTSCDITTDPDDHDCQKRLTDRLLNSHGRPFQEDKMVKLTYLSFPLAKSAPFPVKS